MYMKEQKKTTTKFSKAAKGDTSNTKEIKLYMEALFQKSDENMKHHTEKLISESRKETERYLGALSEEFQGRVTGIAEQFNGVNKKLDVHTVMIGGMKEDIEVIKMNIEIIKADLHKRVTYDDFAALTKRVTLLEKKSHR